MLPGKTFSPDEIARLLLRRRWWLLLPFALGLATVPFVTARIPEIFRSDTLIMVIPQRVPDSYVKSTVTATVEDRLPSISDQILSRSRLERIIGDFDLYKDLRATAPMEDVVGRMRRDIGPIEIQKGQQSFRVSYQSHDPGTAQKVTARLASLFIDENSRDRESLAEGTNVFLESQLEEAKRRLIEHEKTLEAYRRAHSGELPSQLESNLRAIQTLQLQLQSTGESLNRARERRLLVERQLTDAQVPTTAVAQPVTTGGNGEAQGPLTAAQQLEVAERNLETLRLRYTADHPDIRRMERAIAELEQRVAEEARRPAPPVERVQSPLEQARLKRIRDLQTDLEVIDRQLSAGQADEARIKAALADYQSKVDVVPKRESELVELTRDYDILKKTYDSLLLKREDSKLAANLERRQIGEQFRILDPASLPVRPSNQAKRLGLGFAGAGIGLVLGALLVAFLEYRDSSFMREEEVVRVLDLPVLALVPMMPTAHERRKVRLRQLAVDVTGVTVMIASAAVLVAWGIGQL